MAGELETLIEIQSNLIKATEARTAAEIESAIKTQELIDRRNESIKYSQELIESNHLIINNIKSLVDLINALVFKTQPLDLVVQKLDALVTLTQLLIQIISKLNGIDKEFADKLTEQLFKLVELTNSKNNINIHSIGHVDGEQNNIGEDVHAKKE